MARLPFFTLLPFLSSLLLLLLNLVPNPPLIGHRLKRTLAYFGLLELPLQRAYFLFFAFKVLFLPVEEFGPLLLGHHLRDLPSLKKHVVNPRGDQGRRL